MLLIVLIGASPSLASSLPPWLPHPVCPTQRNKDSQMEQKKWKMRRGAISSNKTELCDHFPLSSL